MTFDDLRQELSRRAPGQWELYQKTAESRELESSTALSRSDWRREEGWAARWWEKGAPRFAAGTSPGELFAALPEAASPALETESPPEWPSRTLTCGPGAAAPPPPDLFQDLAQAVGAASRGEARLAELSVRAGTAQERIVNAAGLDVSQAWTILDGLASAVGRRGARAREVRVPFRWSGVPQIEPLARRLSDASTLPLSERPAPFSSGQWLLDPSVAAAILASLAPAFTEERPPRWITRSRIAAPEVRIVDDASADAPFDGEGTATRRVVLMEGGALVDRLEDLRSASRTGRATSGHGVRASFRSPPLVAPRRLFFESSNRATSDQLLSRVTRGLYAAALTGAPRVRHSEDRYEIEFSGISVVGGRAQGPVASARTAGRLSELLRRISGMSSDVQFWPMPFLVGSPTLLVERASFE